MSRISNVAFLTSATVALAFFATSVHPSSVVVPLSEQAKWQVLQYSSLPPHRIRFSQAGLEMRVEGSAMPLIYPLAGRMRVSQLRVKGRVDGSLRLPPGRQGENNFDDYVFRIGLVEPGERTLNFVQRQLAAAWVRKTLRAGAQGDGYLEDSFLQRRGG